MNGRLLGGIFCATVVTVAFLLAHSWYLAVSYSWSTAGAGFALGLIATYSVVFSKPSLVGAMAKPAFILAVMMLVAFGMTVPHGTLSDSWTKLFSIVASVSAIGALGGLGFKLGLKLGK